MNQKQKHTAKDKVPINMNNNGNASSTTATYNPMKLGPHDGHVQHV
jgi:hypothetical protein